ncbi:MAG TPA: sigma-70 family RNA polymerase sigma factor [Bryobacteraceae bacterium]|nr:sigma-70 family RNA polymerase sigma factor [Bryobacteraceae bacterium]
MEVEAGSAVERARAGDSDAFRLLVEQHSRSIFRLAFRMTGNEQDAEDVVQETFLRAYKQLDRYEARSSFSTWLFRIASNYSLDLIRMRKRHEEKRERGSRELGSEEERDILQNIAMDTPGPERQAYGSQVRDRVNEALNELSAQERTAFVLRHFEGLSIEEIGASLGTGANATKHSIFRAVQKLRRNLEPLVGQAR